MGPATSGQDGGLKGRSDGQVITFYSYKGGTGRSLALANVACLLAQRQLREGGKGVLVIDWDLEAPGQHQYFRAHGGNENNRPGLIELFEALRDKTLEYDTEALGEEKAARALIESVGIERFIGPTSAVKGLDLIKAGRFDENYAIRVTTFDWQGLFERSPLLFRTLAEDLGQRYAYILIDSRTGETDVSGICTTLMPEKLVAVFVPNRQSLDGVLNQIRRATAYRKQFPDVRPLVVFPLASRIEVSMPKFLERWQLGDEGPTRGGQVGPGFQPQFEQLLQEIYDLPQCDLTDYFAKDLIPYVPDYAYGEEIAVLTERVRHDLSLSRSFERFTERLATLAGPWERLDREDRGSFAAADTARPGLSTAAKLAWTLGLSLLVFLGVLCHRGSRNAAVLLPPGAAGLCGRVAGRALLLRLVLDDRPPHPDCGDALRPTGAEDGRGRRCVPPRLPLAVGPLCPRPILERPAAGRLEQNQCDVVVSVERHRQPAQCRCAEARRRPEAGGRGA